MTTFYRPTSRHNGVWCCVLLPIALYVSLDPSSYVYELKWVTFLLSVCLSIISVNASYALVYARESEKNGGVIRHFMQSLVSDLFERKSSEVVRNRRRVESEKKKGMRRISVFDPKREKTRTTWVTIGVGAALLFALWKTSSLVLLAYLAVTIVYSCYCIALPALFSHFPGSFTFGEGCIVLQGVVLFVFESATSLLIAADNTATIYGSYAVIAKAGLLSCAMLCLTPMLPRMGWLAQNAVFIPAGFVILFGGTVPYLFHALKRNPITWVLEVIFMSCSRIGLMMFWMFCVIMSISVVYLQTSVSRTRATTRTRKVFHGLAVAVYTSGVLLDKELMFLASIVALCVFILLEAIRIYDIRPFAALLDFYFQLFLDAKDQGKLILTNIYLLVGCSLPLWIAEYNSTSVSDLALLSGVLSIGIGDSAASIIGSKYGRTKFPDSDKSLEGTAASVLAQLGFIWCLKAPGLLTLRADLNSLLPPIIIGALVEALTTQIDNLVLPLILFSMLY